MSFYDELKKQRSSGTNNTEKKEVSFYDELKKQRSESISNARKSANEKLLADYDAYDREVGQSEIDRLQLAVDSIPVMPVYNNTDRGSAALAKSNAYNAEMEKWSSTYGMTPEEAKKSLYDKTEYHKAATEHQDRKQQRGVYDSYRESPDFEQNSGYKSTRKDGWDTVYETEIDAKYGRNNSTNAYDDIIYEIVNGNRDAIARYRTKDDRDFSTFYREYMGFDSIDYLTRLEPEEVSTFNYLYNT